jgi:hypothetical protein
LKKQLLVIWIVLPGLVCIRFAGKANEGSIPAGARENGLCGAGIMLADEWSGFHNQAGLAAINRITLALYAENRFLLPDLGLGAFTCTLPFKPGTFAVNYACFGSASYLETHASLAYGKAFGEKFRAGIALNYMNILQSADYGRLYAFVPGIGIQAIPYPGLTIGFHVFNPACQQYNASGTNAIPSTIRAGLSYAMGDHILLCVETEKRSGAWPLYRGGAEIRPDEKLVFRMGISSSRLSQYAFGIGVRLQHLQFDISAVHHPVLGFSPSISVFYLFKR